MDDLPGPDNVRAVLQHVLAGRDCVVAGATPLPVLDGAAAALQQRRTRLIRISPAAGQTSLSSLMAQVAAAPDLSAQDDAVLEKGFTTLTVVDATCDRIVLMIDQLDTLSPAALRYVQFTCRSGGAPILVVAGDPAFIGGLAAAGYAPLAARLTRDAPVSASTPGVPIPAAPASTRRRRPTLAWAGFGAAMAASVALGMAIERHGGQAPPLPEPQSAQIPPPAPAPPAASSGGQARPADDPAPAAPAPTPPAVAAPALAAVAPAAIAPAVLVSPATVPPATQAPAPIVIEPPHAEAPPPAPRVPVAEAPPPAEPSPPPPPEPPPEPPRLQPPVAPVAEAPRPPVPQAVPPPRAETGQSEPPPHAAPNRRASTSARNTSPPARPSNPRRRTQDTEDGHTQSSAEARAVPAYPQPDPLPARQPPYIGSVTTDGNGNRTFRYGPPP